MGLQGFGALSDQRGPLRETQRVPSGLGCARSGDSAVEFRLPCDGTVCKNGSCGGVDHVQPVWVLDALTVERERVGAAEVEHDAPRGTKGTEC